MTHTPSPDTPPSYSVNEPCKLPGSMSGLLTAAIADARSLNPDIYIPNSFKWHTTNNNGDCFFCLAGSLIARTLNNGSTFPTTLFPEHFSLDTDHKLRAVDAMRLGEWFEAFSLLYINDPCPQAFKLLSELPVPLYRNFEGWGSLHAHLSSLEKLLPQLRWIDKLGGAEL